MFADRRVGGRALARALSKYADAAPLVVLGLPRGGLPVAREVADAFDATLDVLVVRKLGVPGHGELAFGAIASGGVRVLNGDVVRAWHVTDADIEQVAARESTELIRRERLYRGDAPFPSLDGVTVVVVDDGLATGATMRAAAVAVRQLGAATVVCATPVAATQSMSLVSEVADDVVAAYSTPLFRAVGSFYDDFTQTTDDEVRTCLTRAGSNLP